MKSLVHITVVLEAKDEQVSAEYKPECHLMYKKLRTMQDYKQHQKKKEVKEKKNAEKRLKQYSNVVLLSVCYANNPHPHPEKKPPKTNNKGQTSIRGQFG